GVGRYSRLIFAALRIGVTLLKPASLAGRAQLKQCVLVAARAGLVGSLVDPAMGVDFAKGMLMAAAVTCPRAFL
ncbi:hypothetical protein, partial [Sinorhizobium meliloti]|uniref:hypothetical protein n=1 Tax=Rhizobium meliloti TaxID=382 RepID=UPI001AECDAC0